MIVSRVKDFRVRYRSHENPVLHNFISRVSLKANSRNERTRETKMKSFFYLISYTVFMSDEEFIQDKNVKEVLKKAKELEKDIPLSSEEIVKIFKDGTEQTVVLNKMLKKVWFVRDEHAVEKKK